MKEIFNDLNDLEKDKFELCNSSNKFELRIKYQILKKLKELTISLEPKSEPKEETIQRLLNKVEQQTNRIEYLEKEIKTLLEQKEKGKQPKKENEEKPEKEKVEEEEDEKRRRRK